MAPTPVRHPLRDTQVLARRRAIAAHPAGRARRSVDAGATPVDVVPTPAGAARGPQAADADRRHGQAGSMTTEYGLIVVVGATVASLVIKWASGGAVFELLGGVLQAAKGLVGI